MYKKTIFIWITAILMVLGTLISATADSTVAFQEGCGAVFCNYTDSVYDNSLRERIPGTNYGNAATLDLYDNEVPNGPSRHAYWFNLSRLPANRKIEESAIHGSPGAQRDK